MNTHLQKNPVTGNNSTWKLKHLGVKQPLFIHASRLGMIEMISISFKICGCLVWGFHLLNSQPGRSHLAQVMKVRAAANVQRAAPGPTATSLFASDVCLGPWHWSGPDAEIVICTRSG